MTERVWKVGPLAFEGSQLLAQLLAFKLKTGDCLALSGEVGAGKTTLARAIIRAMASDPDLDVASPTYALMQSYDCERARVQHYDFYRLNHADEALEIGFEDDAQECITLVEWPDRAEEILPSPRLGIHIEEVLGSDENEARIYEIKADGEIGSRLQRLQEIWHFLSDWAEASGATHEISLNYLQGDASARAYAQLHQDDQSWILMDSPRQPDGPPIREGKSYSQLAHLAEDICPFVAIAEELSRHGLSTPRIDRVDFQSGLAVIEDLGPQVFGRLIDAGHDQRALYSAATDVLVEIAQLNVPSLLRAGDCSHDMPHYSRSVLLNETELLLDWYCRWSTGADLMQAARKSFLELWSAQLRGLEDTRQGWVLRDFHSPNLIWLPDREGPAQVGLIDFQDAQIGHSAYDLVSLLQDARLDVREQLEAELLTRYCELRSEREGDFDETAFRSGYAVLGAQRNTKILGIFARLAERDGKPQYLRHIPRITRYIRRNLEHSDLAQLQVWYNENLPGLFEA